MKDLSSKMCELKMEITGSDESSGKKEVSVQEHEAERLAEHGRLMEELTVLQTQLTSVEAERAALETKSTQQQTAYEDILAKYEVLRAEHDDCGTMKAAHQDLQKNYKELQQKLDGCTPSTLSPIL